MNTTSQRIWLTLLLDGGQRESLSVDVTSPLLDQLKLAFTDPRQAPALFEIPLKEGTALLTLPASRIVGAITEPPVPLTLPAIAAPAGPVGVPAPGVPNGFEKAHAIQVKNVLTAEQHTALLKLVDDRAQAFVPTQTSTSASNYRESVLLYDFAPFDELLRARVRHLLPKVCEALKLPVPTGSIEAQLTAHNDNNFYKTHNDNSSADTAHRTLTFVYYFNRSPKAYEGGQLRIYDRKFENGYQLAADSYMTIEPEDNSIVFFASGEMHEVLPVVCPSQAFMNSRFTINGWVAKG